MKLIDSGYVYDARGAAGHRRSCAFSAVTLLNDGTLLVTFRRGSARESVDGHACVFASTDGGKTWEERYDGVGQATWNGVPGEEKAILVAELTPGELLASTLWVDRSGPPRPWINPQTTGLIQMTICHLTSRDGGRTWTDRRALDTHEHPAASPTGPVLRLADERLAQPYEHWKWYDDPNPGRPAALLRISEDNGHTWPSFTTVAADPTNTIFYWDQRLATHPETGQLVAMFWTHHAPAGQDFDIHIAWGTSDGTKWSTPTATGLPGQHCQPVPLGGNRLAAVYSHRPDPPGIRAVLSEDFGRTWDRKTEVVVYDSSEGMESGSEGRRELEEYWADMERWRFGHPRGVLLPSGEVFMVYYAGDDQTKSVRWARLTV
jgi:hypothetical protein